MGVSSIFKENFKGDSRKIELSLEEAFMVFQESYKVTSKKFKVFTRKFNPIQGGAKTSALHFFIKLL